MLVIALVVELSSDALRRLFVPDLGGVAGIAVGLLWLPLFLGVLLWKLIIEPLRQEQQASITELRHQRRELSAEASRLDFDARLLGALEMTDDEGDVFEVVEQALTIVAPGTSAEVLLADGNAPDLKRVASSVDAEPPRCPVARTNDCPAVRQGRTLTFDDSTGLAACPKLRNRTDTPIAATCVPVSVMGHSTGVVHLTRPASSSEVTQQTDRLESLATRAGARIELIRALADSREQAGTDPLTGLANRRTLDVRYRELDPHSVHGLLLCDLDHFKHLNDTHGHDIGDQALVRFAEVLRRASRPDDVVARFGGEEFVVLLPDQDRDVAAAVGERIRKLLAETLQHGSIPPFTTSIGTADARSGRRLDDLVAAADVALYEAKRTGRDRVVTAPLHPVGPSQRPAVAAVPNDEAGEADSLPLSPTAPSSPAPRSADPRSG